MSDLNNIPEGWKVKRLDEITELIVDCPHSTPLWTDEGFIVLRSQNIRNGKLNFSKTSFTNEKGYLNRIKRAIPKEGDLVLTREAPMGEVCMIPSEIQCCLGQRMVLIRILNKEACNKFILYAFQSLFLKVQINWNKGTGTTVSNIRIPNIKAFIFNLPPLPEQKSIASILTSFDEKIELLQSQNKTLETIAQTIFKEWFGKYQVGDELPEGWRVGKIGDLTEIKRGGSPRPIKDYISDSGYRWLKISDATATKSPYIFEIKEHIKVEGLKKTTLKKAGDLVLSNSATPGMPKFLAVDTCVHDGWMHFPSSKVSNEYLYLLFLHIRPKLVQQGSGSVFVNLKTDILRYYETVIPADEIFRDFDKIVKPIFNKIYANAEQIQTLTKTRDTLLPKLMSGAIRVKDLKKS